jgi:hypothetical protein
MKRLKQTYCLLLIALTCCTLPLLAGNQETVYLQTDRSVYISGETVFFKLNVFDATTKKRSELSKVGYMELRAPKSAPVLKIRVSVAEGVASGSFVLPDSLHSDVYQLVAFTAYMKNVGENSFYHRSVLIANRLDKDLNLKSIAPSNRSTVTESLLSIQTDKTAYAPGENVKLRLGSVFTDANLTVSVFEEPSVSLPEKSLLEVLQAAPAPSQLQRYLPEKPFKILRGRVLDATTNQSVQDAIVLLSCPDSVANLQYAISDSQGLIQMQLSPYYDGKELFFSIKEMPTEQNWKIEVEDNFEISTPWEPELTALQGSAKDYLLKSQDIAYINKTYAVRSGKAEKPQSSAPFFCPLLYRRPVKPVFPADFVALDSFPEISVELLPSLKLYKQDGIYHARTITREQQLYGRNDATFFLDGVYLDDINKIIALNSEKIKKIDVIENKRAFGNVLFYGLVSIQTHTNEILKTVPDAHSLRLKNDTVTVGKNVVAQLPPTSQEPSTPFFKQLLYWNPSATLQTDYTFHTSENTGTFLIKAEGITKEGTPISATIRIQVNNPKTAPEK